VLAVILNVRIWLIAAHSTVSNLRQLSDAKPKYRIVMPTASDSRQWEWTTVPHHRPVLDLLAGLRNHARPRCPDRRGTHSRPTGALTTK
jgi:hypothetical protein